MSSKKLPAFQMYPGDWRKDPGVQALDYEYRGIWFEILLLMHESDQRGKLLLNGKPMPEDALARLLGLDKQKVSKAITTLLDYGVASIDEDTSALMNRRMVRDEDIRQKRRKAGKKGGNPDLLNQKSSKKNKKDNQNYNQNTTPSSSSSSSTSINDTHTHRAREEPSFIMSKRTDRQKTDLDPEADIPEKEEWREYLLASLRYSKEFVEHLWDHAMVNGWCTGEGGTKPIKDWRAYARKQNQWAYEYNQKQKQLESNTQSNGSDNKRTKGDRHVDFLSS